MSTTSARPRRWKRIEYEELIDRGIFQPGERLEPSSRISVARLTR